MLMLGIDLETSGIDKKTSNILEIAYVLKRVGEKRPWLTRAEFIYDPSWGDNFIPKEASLVNGIHPDHCKRFGVPLSSVAREINGLIKSHRVDCIVAHNGRDFDLPFLMHHIGGLSTDHWDHIKACPLLDTMRDIEYPKSCKSRSLAYLCADHGFLIGNAHSALYDTLATLRLAECYDVEAALANAREPSSVYKANTKNPWDDNNVSKDRAKACGFSWENLGDRKFPKAWVRRLRDNQVEGVVAELGFGVTKLSE